MINQLRIHGFEGKIEIRVYVGLRKRLTSRIRNGLTIVKVTLECADSDMKNAADELLIKQLEKILPERVNYVLIGGDFIYVKPLGRMKDWGLNVILLYPANSTNVDLKKMVASGLD